MGKPGPSGTQKRRADATVEENVSKRVLKTNRFAVLAESVEKKERCPPFYTKGFPEELYSKLDYYVKQGLQVTLRRCTDEYKITVPCIKHYRAVETFLNINKMEYFTHDMEADKPFKAILRGLDDMETDKLEAELQEAGLKPAKIFKIRRHDSNKRYRDQLYLVHFPKGSTSLKELQDIRALFYHVVQWERYKPTYREVTQCSNCLNFGHGAKNCHIQSRCSNCGDNHATADCAAEEPKPTCVNCGQGHSSTSRACPKRAEFIQFRRQVNQRNHRPKKQVAIDLSNFPELAPPKGTIPVPESQRKSNTGPPPGFWASAPGAGPPNSSFQQGHSPPPPPDGMTQVLNQLTSLVTEMQKMLMQMMQFFMRCNVQPKAP